MVILLAWIFAIIVALALNFMISSLLGWSSTTRNGISLGSMLVFSLCLLVGVVIAEHLKRILEKLRK